MKQAKRFRAVLSIVLIITMLMSVAAVGLVGISAAEALTITYSYKYDNAGYAEGRVRLTAGSEADYGKYYLYWADDTKALEGYAPITTLNLNGASKSFTFGEFTAIPAGATKLIAVKNATAKTVAAAAAVYDIPESKQFKYDASEMEYRYQALSDIHIQHDDSYWVYSKQHWANALEVAAQRGAEFITVCGDAVNGYGASNLQKEWPMYLQIIADSSFTGPVYETNGNHEIKGNGGDLAQQADHDLYMIGSGLNVETEAMQSETYYEVTGPSGDHYIFMVLEKSGAPNEYSEFSDEQLDWLEGLLKKYYNDGNKIIINQHALTRNYGAGDDLVTPYYKGGLLDSYEGEQHYDVQRFKALLEEYPNVIWFSGHSHIDFKYNYNISNMDGTTAYTVHIPACTSTTHPVSGSYDATVGAGSTNYVMSEDSSQGWFVDMYEDAVVLNGTDLAANEFLPLYTYMIDYSGDELIENEVEGGDDTENFTKVVVTVDASVFNAQSVKATLYGADDDLLTQEVTMTKDTDGLYKANVSTQFTKMKFTVNNGTANIKSAEYDIADCKVVLGAYKIAFTNTYGWTNVNVYVWDTNGGDAVAWPGMAMTKEADGTYTATVPDYANKIIFNNGSGQTDDLDIASYITETIGGSYTVNSTPTPTIPEDTTPTEPAEPVETVTIYLNKPTDWEGAYVYGFYGVEGGTATGEPMGAYPGKKMTQVDGNVYSFDVPADIDYIKFSDGSATNRRTNNIPNAKIGADVLFTLTASGSKWDATASTYTGAKSVASVGAGASNYAIRGTFTDWGSNDAISFIDGSSTKIEATYTLSAGEYKFKVYNMSTGVWYGNDGTIEGACDNWGFRDGRGDATLNITEAGKYTFTVDVSDSSRLGMTIAKAAEAPVTTAPTEAPTPVPTTAPATTAPADTPETTAPAEESDTISVYFTNNKGWDNAYIYGFYGVVGEESTGEPLGTYPGTQMTYVSTNSYGQDIYKVAVPADIDYIKFSDGSEANERTDNIPNAEIEDGIGFYLTEKGTKYWGYDTYEYVEDTPVEPTTVAPTATATTTTTGDEPATTVAATVAPSATNPADDEPDTITVYFTNNRDWDNAYVYGFYGVVGEESTGEPLGTYPGTQMIYVSTNSYGQDIYKVAVPADIDYIKFSDGSEANERTDNIPNAEIEDGIGFYLTEKGTKYWGYDTYEYVEDTPVEPTTVAPTAASTTVENTTVAPTVAPTAVENTTAAPTVVPTTVIPTAVNTTVPAVTPEPVVLYYGDADQSGKVNVKDATAIQKHVAGLITLSENGVMVADVDGYTGVNVKDATCIQKLIAGIITELPSGETLVIGTVAPTAAPTTVPATTPAPTPVPTTVPATTVPPTPPAPDTDLAKLLATVKKTLSDENYYASYVAYANLKKAYYEYKDLYVAEDDMAAAISEVNTAVTAYNTMKKNNPDHVNAYKAPQPGSYLLRGTMNNWDESGVMSADGNGVSITYELAAGTHQLKVYDVDTGKWYGNGGTFTDTCSGWTMTDTAGDLSFTATGGTYKFLVVFDGGKVKLTVTKL